MKGKIPLSVTGAMALVVILSFEAEASDPWQAPFDITGTKIESQDSTLSLDDVLALVAAENQSLRSLVFQLKAADGNLKQAGLLSNPEVDVELEGFGWDAPGFSESEFSISLSQEFEFFGQRGARKDVARAGLEALTWETKLAAFDLYSETKQRFFALAHAQEKAHLCQASVDLAREIVENTQFRLDHGAALQSELLLGQLEEQRALLALDQAKQDVDAFRATLASLYRGSPTGLVVSCAREPDLVTLLEKLAPLTRQTDSSRTVLELRSESGILRAEKMLAVAEARPTISLSSGFKRAEIDGAKSLVFGISLPIPFLNRNQGTQASLEAQLRSIDYEIDQAEHEVHASLQASTILLKQMVDRHAVLDSVLLPTAERAYKSLKSDYETGRLPYSHLLEAERALNELNFTHNDLLLTIQEQIIAIESITGVVLRADKED